MADEEKLIAIKVLKDGRNGGRVYVSINGQPRYIDVDKEVSVSEAVVEALKNSDITFELVGGDDGVTDPSAGTDAVPQSEVALLTPQDADGDAGVGNIPDDQELGTGADPTQGTQTTPPDDAQSGTTTSDSLKATDNAGPPAQTGNDPDKDLLSGNLDSVREAVSTMTDRERLNRLLAAEKAEGDAKARKGAVAAIEARIAELNESEA